MNTTANIYGTPSAYNQTQYASPYQQLPHQQLSTASVSQNTYSSTPTAINTGTVPLTMQGGYVPPTQHFSSNTSAQSGTTTVPPQHGTPGASQHTASSAPTMANPYGPLGNNNSGAIYDTSAHPVSTPPGFTQPRNVFFKTDDTLKLFTESISNMCKCLSSGIEHADLYVRNYNLILKNHGIPVITIPQSVIDSSKNLFAFNSSLNPSLTAAISTAQSSVSTPLNSTDSTTTSNNSTLPTSLNKLTQTNRSYNTTTESKSMATSTHTDTSNNNPVLASDSLNMNNGTTNSHVDTVSTTKPEQLGDSNSSSNATTPNKSHTDKLAESTPIVDPNCSDTPRRNTSKDSDTHNNTYNEPTLINDDLIQFSQPLLSPLPTLSPTPLIYSSHNSPLYPVTSPFLSELFSTPARIVDKFDNYITRVRNSLTPYSPTKLTRNPDFKA